MRKNRIYIGARNFKKSWETCYFNNSGPPGPLSTKNNIDSPESLNMIFLTHSSFQPLFYNMLVPAFLTACFFTGHVHLASFTDSLDFTDTLHSPIFFAIRSAISLTDICR